MERGVYAAVRLAEAAAGLDRLAWHRFRRCAPRRVRGVKARPGCSLHRKARRRRRLRRTRNSATSGAATATTVVTALYFVEFSNGYGSSGMHSELEAK